MMWLLMFLSHLSWAAEYPSPSSMPTQAPFAYRGWLMSEKLDGVRALWNGAELQTRQGYRIDSPDWFTQDFPNFALDGELWIRPSAFAEVSAIVRTGREHKDWSTVAYYVFEVPKQQGGLLERLQPLEHYLQLKPIPHLKIIEQRTINSQEQMMAFYDTVLEHGGEGVIIRDGSTAYQTGRLSTMFKLKPTQDAECLVEGYKEGKGRLKGAVGAIECRLILSQQLRLFPKLGASAVTIWVGSGLSDLQRQSPPKIGSVMTFKYSGTTKTGLPRFVRFYRIREEEVLLQE